MRFFFTFLFLLLISCTDKSENLVDVESFIKLGEKQQLSNSINLNDQNKKLINKLSGIKYYNYLNWSESYHNSKNLITPAKIQINKKKISVKNELIKFLIHDQKIITIDRKSKIKILDLNFKTIITKKIYKREIYKNYNIDSKIIANKDKLFISDNLGNIHCLDLKTLKILWKKNYTVPFRSNLKINNNNLFLMNSNSKIFSINTKSGDLNWSFETASKKFKDNSSYQIAISNEKLFFTNDSGEIYCIDLKTGNILWSVVFTTDNFENKPILLKFSPITLDQNGSLFVSSNYGKTYMIDAKSGLVKWSKPIYFTDRFTLTKDYLLNTYNNRLVVLKKTNGDVVLNKVIKDSKSKKNFTFKDILVGQNSIYLFDSSGYLVSINSENFDKYYITRPLKNFMGSLIYKKELFIWSEKTMVKF